jgi:hypothetical protein
MIGARADWIEIDGEIFRCKRYGHECNLCVDKKKCPILNTGKELNELGEIIE